jgi:hypothetical protein
MGGANDLVRPRVLATGTASIATVTTTNIDFGTPDDVKVAVGANFKQNDRLVLVLAMSTAGTTDTTSVSVQDAPDSGGSIGTPATAVTTGTLTGGTGNQYVVAGIKLQSGRPWIRVRVTRASGTTDTHVVRAVLLAVPHNF